MLVSSRREDGKAWAPLRASQEDARIELYSWIMRERAKCLNSFIHDKWPSCYSLFMISHSLTIHIRMQLFMNNCTPQQGLRFTVHITHTPFIHPVWTPLSDTVHTPISYVASEHRLNTTLGLTVSCLNTTQEYYLRWSHRPGRGLGAWTGLRL